MMKTFLTFLATQQLLYQTILSGVLNALFLAKKLAQVFWDLKLSFVLRQNWPWLEDFKLNSQD